MNFPRTDDARRSRHVRTCLRLSAGGAVGGLFAGLIVGEVVGVALDSVPNDVNILAATGGVFALVGALWGIALGCRRSADTTDMTPSSSALSHGKTP